MIKYTRAHVVTKSLTESEFAYALLDEIEMSLKNLTTLPIHAFEEMDSYVGSILEKFKELSKKINESNKIEDGYDYNSIPI